MKLSAEVIQKIEDVAASALEKIGAENIPKKAKLAVKFATSQPPAEITLDSTDVVAVAVDIASVYTPEGYYRNYIDENGVARTMESCQVLSIVVLGDNVILCKSTYDVLTGSSFEDAKFVNARYWTTSVDMLTEKYIC